MSAKLNAILKQLRSQGTDKNLAGMTRFGISTEKAFGVPHPALHAIAKQHRRDHALAQELWASGYHEARLLAAFVDDPKQVTKTQMDAWVRDFNSWDICDTVTGHLFEPTPYAFDKAYQWTRSKREFVRRAGLAMMAWLAVHRKQEPEDTFLGFFPAIEAVVEDERNFVKKASSWALRQLGKRSKFLNKHAVAFAKRIARAAEVSGSKPARWVAADVLREISSDKTLARLR
ncbi:MAG TPA: DNA alkylation repair protein [Anaerolineales bacterium]|nr:DNA alkylation repair protein [Anaerolineales bacterium]HRQ91773.1 DNA alkylation repair protein [Anaerolineales bacterium]